VDADVAVQGATLGCSIAVNGVCLTAIEFDEHKARFGLAPETLRRSNLAKLQTGDPVNLERALAADGRNSGHFVQGHVSRRLRAAPRTRAAAMPRHTHESVLHGRCTRVHVTERTTHALPTRQVDDMGTIVKLDPDVRARRAAAAPPRLPRPVRENWSHLHSCSCGCAPRVRRVTRSMSL
jgi:hypothetical protein